MSNEPWANNESEAPLRIDLIRVLGTHLSRHSFLHSLTSNVFNVTTAKNMFEQVQKSSIQLQRTGVFDNFQINLDAKSKEAVDMTILLKEKDKGFIKSEIIANHNQAELSGGLGIRNIFGGGESIYSNFSFGNFTNAATETITETYIPGCANIKAGILASGFIKDRSQISAFEEATRSAAVYLKGWSNLGEHEIGCSIAEREIVPYSTSSSFVQNQEGSHFKYSLYHKFIRDERDNILLPTSGHYLGITQEVAGLKDQGDISFVKHELKASYHQPLNRYMTLNTSVHAGLLTHVSKIDSILDRFYLGGPLSVRGFKIAGIGERENDDVIGGKAYYAAGISIVSAIPKLESAPVKLHAFVNGGNLVSDVTNAKEFTQESRSSVGLGLIFHHSIARVEANYCIPIKYSGNDSIEPKFQFGFGVDFL